MSSSNNNAATATKNGDSPSFGLAFLGFWFPLIGFILFLTLKPNHPRKSKSAGKGALTGAIVATVLSIISCAVFTVWYIMSLGY